MQINMKRNRHCFTNKVSYVGKYLNTCQRLDDLRSKRIWDIKLFMLMSNDE